MKRYILYLLLLCCTACETVIPYNGVADEPQMVVGVSLTNDTLFNAIVSRTYFFMDEVNQSYDLRLNDAVVQFQVNDGEWQRADKVPANAEKPYDMSRFNFTKRTSKPFQPYDTVRIKVTDKKFGTATAQQVFPKQPSFTIKDVRQDAETLSFLLHIDAYPASADVVLGIGAYINETVIVNLSEALVQTREYWRIFSPDAIFALLTNSQKGTDDAVLESINNHYFTIREIMPLFLPTNQVEQGRDIWIVILKEQYQRVTDATIKIQLSAMPIDYYYYVTSMAMANDDISTPSTGNIFGDMMEEFGEQESVQIYSNISGGIGALLVSSKAEQSMTFKVRNNVYYFTNPFPIPSLHLP